MILKQVSKQASTIPKQPRYENQINPVPTEGLIPYMFIVRNVQTKRLKEEEEKRVISEMKQIAILYF